MKNQISIKDTNQKAEIVGVHKKFNLYIVKFEDGTIKEVSPHLVVFPQNKNKPMTIFCPFTNLQYDYYDYCAEMVRNINSQINFNLRLIETLEDTQERCWQVLNYSNDYKNKLRQLKESIRELRNIKIKIAQLIKQVH